MRAKLIKANVGGADVAAVGAVIEDHSSRHREHSAAIVNKHTHELDHMWMRTDDIINAG